MKADKIERRRGSRLEDAILDAAWAELVERGYPGLTLEGVAKRAGTSRPVLHRRWQSRTALATAALGRHIAQHPIVVPDLGSVRDESVFCFAGCPTAPGLT
jgi:AcrR family transcriptional regulator